MRSILTNHETANIVSSDLTLVFFIFVSHGYTGVIVPVK